MASASKESWGVMGGRVGEHAGLPRLGSRLHRPRDRSPGRPAARVARRVNRQGQQCSVVSPLAVAESASPQAVRKTFANGQGPPTA
jgi:hypothetical protein